jgi:hypothetical protein
MPLTGYFSAFVIYPLLGDYLYAASIALALVAATFISALFMALYRFFYVVCKDVVFACFWAVLAIVLCFVFFKDNRTDNVFLFFAFEYNLYFFYIFPNILNSIVVLELLRRLALRGKLSLMPERAASQGAKALPGLREGMLLLVVYFCVFSLLFAAAILFSFAVAVAISRFYSAMKLKEKLVLRMKGFCREFFIDYNIALLIIVATIFAMILESTSLRSKSSGFGTYFGSPLSRVFLGRIGMSADYLGRNLLSINEYVCVLMIMVFVLAGIVHHRKRKSESAPSPLVNFAGMCLIAGGFLSAFYILLAAKAGPHYLTWIQCTYGVFFFLIICVILLCLFIMQEVKISRVFVPFVLLALILVMFNSYWSYRKLAPTYRDDLVHSLVQMLAEADSLGYTEIELYISEGSRQLEGGWEIDCLTDMLNNHNVTARKVNVEVKYSNDGSAYYVPK